MVNNKLDKAIGLHQKHMDKPATATMKSQQQLMDLLKEHKSEMMEHKSEMMEHKSEMMGEYEKEMPRKAKTLVG